MSRNCHWHLLDPRGDTYCGSAVPGLQAVRTFASLAAVDREAEDATERNEQGLKKSGPTVCVQCRDNRRMRGHA